MLVRLEGMRPACCCGMLRFTLLSCTVLALRAEAATSQRPPDRVGAWVGVARHSPFVTRAGTRHRDLYALGLHAEWALGAFPGVTVSYTSDILPIVVTTNNVNDFEVRVRRCGPTVDCFYTELHTGTVLGTGLSPIGLTAAIGPIASVSILLNASAGALWFSQAVPDPQALRFNFTASGGAAVEVPLRAGYAALVGYMRHHTSNAGIGRVNPGLDSNVWYVGMTRRKQRLRTAERGVSPEESSPPR